MSHLGLGSPQTLVFSPLTCCESLQMLLWPRLKVALIYGISINMYVIKVIYFICMGVLLA